MIGFLKFSGIPRNYALTIVLLFNEAEALADEAADEVTGETLKKRGTKKKAIMLLI